MVETPETSLDWSEPGAPRSRRFGDVYYSLEDGLAESRTVFLDGCGLPDAWAGRERFTVAELGFGTGLNIAALLHLWRQSGAAGRLHIFSVEGFPVARDDAARALSAWPEIAGAAAALLDRWPPAAPGFHRIDLPGWNATLDLAAGDAAWALDQWSGAADAWFLDGFSPALNPDMWSDAVLNGVAARSAPGARVATFTVAGTVRRGLAARGFTVDKRPGHGRKRERLEAVLPGTAAAPTRGRAAVIGAGIAGASVLRALRAEGWAPILIEAEGTGAGASGFPASLVTPRLDAGDAELARLFAQMLARASALYDAVPGGVVGRGVLRLEHAARDARRFDAVAAQVWWPQQAMQRVTAAEASALLGETVERGGLIMRDALTVRGGAVLDQWLAAADRAPGRATLLERADGAWRVTDAAGGLIAEAEAVVLAAGWETDALWPGRLQAVRGQATWAQGVSAPDVGVAWGGYAAPTADGVLFGATHDRDDADCSIRPGDDAHNLETLEAVLPGLADRIRAAGTTARAAVRAVTRDRLPVAGRLDDGLLVLGGLGSRGFTAAPLLGEHVAALITGAPSPAPASLARRIDPLRAALTRG